MSSNVHSSTPRDDAVEASLVDEPVGAMLRRVFLAWERLRVLYDGALAPIVPGFVVFNIHVLLTVKFRLIGVHAAIIANIRYFAGPIYESYATWLGWRTTGVRPTLFIAGTLVSCAMAATFMASFR